MKNIKLTISYDGTDFNGWQTQPGYRTVQETLERAIAELTDEGMRRLESAAPGHVEAVRRDFVDLLTPGQLEIIGEVFARIDQAIGERAD